MDEKYRYEYVGITMETFEVLEKILANSIVSHVYSKMYDGVLKFFWKQLFHLGVIKNKFLITAQLTALNNRLMLI